LAGAARGGVFIRPGRYRPQWYLRRQKGAALTNPWQPYGENVPLCDNGHPMAATDQRCALCGAGRKSDSPAEPGSQPPPGSEQETTGFPGSAGVSGPPGGFQQPWGYQDPAGYQQAGGNPPAGYQAPAWGSYPGQPGAGSWGPQGGYPMAARKTNPLAIASLVLGIIWIFWLGSVAALIFGYISLSQIKRRNEAGRGMAIAGVVLGWFGIATLILGIIGAVVAQLHSASPP